MRFEGEDNRAARTVLAARAVGWAGARWPRASESFVRATPRSRTSPSNSQTPECLKARQKLNWP